MPDTQPQAAPRARTGAHPAPPEAARAQARNDPSSRLSRTALMARYRSVRAATEQLAAPLSPEDQMLQSMEDASPVRWHRAHTTWFFETFVLKPLVPGYRPVDAAYDYLFNSYYQAVGPQYPRPARGLVSRPGVAEITAYRGRVGAAIAALAESADDAIWAEAAPLIELGLHHEQQHQELIVTDLKHALSFNPLRPAIYAAPDWPAQAGVPAQGWTAHDGGLVECGHDTRDPEAGFAYDCEGPRHRQWLDPFALADRPVTNGEYLSFIADGGYTTPRWWHAEGWDRVTREGWQAPLYWWREGGRWHSYTLSGPRPVNPAEPVCHVSFFEAAAYAAWASEALGMAVRLPTEFELEHAARQHAVEGRFAGPEPGARALHPAPAGHGSSRGPDGTGSRTGGPQQLYGDVWEWTLSAYAPYPGYRPARGAIGEYNGKFMANQQVLRGGSVATPDGHMRPTYRNFFPAHARWQFSGIRLARTL